MTATRIIDDVGIVGLGAAGRRHVRILRSLRPNLTFSAYRTNKGGLREPVEGVANLDRDRFLSTRFDLLVISNPSALHLDALAMILPANPSAIILIEKPFCLPGEIQAMKALMAAYPEARILPGNCLRFHSAIVLLKEEMERGALGEPMECHAHFGTYMPGWHPYEDYRTTYAARREMGGGALLTSIHEIDLVHHLFGDGEVLGAIADNILLADIDVEDCAHAILSLRHCHICNISLNFFERPAQRYFKLVCRNGSFSWTFGESQVTMTLWKDGHPEPVCFPVDTSVDSMFLNMWQNVLNHSFQSFELGSVEASLRTVATILARTEFKTCK